MLSFTSRLGYIAFSAVLLLLLSGCNNSPTLATNPTQVASSSSGPLQTPLGPTLPPPDAASSVLPTPPPPDPLATEQARLGPVNTPTPTIDPSLPTATLTPRPTHVPTPTPLPPAPPLTQPLPDPHQPGVQYFPQTGHTLRGVFLEYWNQNGGADRFGYPITEQFYESDSENVQPVIVQYLEKARMEIQVAQSSSGDEGQTQAGKTGSPTPMPSPSPSLKDVQVTPDGKQLAQQKGYFTGTYPHYGHALDFSWLSGHLTLYASPKCSAPDCGCSIFRYGSSNEQMQLDGPVWGTYQLYNYIIGDFFVVFGRIAKANENVSICSALAAPVYIVEGLQMKPNP